MLHRKQCKDYIQNNSEYECCVLCGCLTDIPKSMSIEKRWGYIEGAGQLCRECAIKNAADEKAAMQRGYVYSFPVYETE